MNVISKPNLFKAAAEIGDPTLEEKVVRWYELATRNDFKSFVELKQTFPSVDLVGDYLVFNLASYRLICGFSFLRRIFFFKHLLSHSDYEKGSWK